jgi:hypothetical protein
MGVTNFPNEISSDGVVRQSGVAAVTGAGTVATTLDTITGVQVSLAGLPGTATADVIAVGGTAHVNTAGAATFIARTVRADGTAGTAAKNVVWTAFGTKA